MYYVSTLNGEYRTLWWEPVYVKNIDGYEEMIIVFQSLDGSWMAIEDCEINVILEVLQ